MKPNRIFYLLLVSMWACSPKLQVSKMDLPADQHSIPAAPTDDTGGVYYALPLSIITVDIPITKIDKSKGSCFDEKDSFTMKLLEERGDSALVKRWADTTNKGTYTFYKLHTNEITISTRPAPDPAKVYYATLKNKWNKNQQLTLNMNELGQLTRGEFVNEDHTFDIVVQGVTAIAGVVSTLLPVKSSTLSGAIKAATDTTTLEWQIAHYGDPKKQCFEQKKSLLTIRKTRFDLAIANSTSGDPTIYKRKIDDLDALEAGILASLTYEEIKTKAILHMDILVPDAENLKDIPLFTFHPEKGVKILAKTQPGTYQNEYLSYFESDDLPAESKTYYLTFDYVKGNQFADRAYSSSTQATKPGIAYNMPVTVRGRIQVVKAAEDTVREKPVAVAMLPMPQLGKVAYLPERASKVGFDLDPLTGALRTVSLQQTGLTADQIKAAGEAATAGITAVKKPAAKTDLENIQGENALLEQQIKKINQQNKLDSLLGKQSRGSQ